MRTQILSEQEVAALLSVLERCSFRDHLIIRLMLQCGLRAGEIAALNVEHIWRAGFVHPAVYLQKSTTKGHITRYVDIPASLQPVILTHIEKMSFAGIPCVQDTPLFISINTKKRISVRDVERIAGKISLLAIGRAVHPHLLRHTYATTLMKYTNIRVVQTLLGHASLNTTQLYTHPSSEDCKNAVNRAFK